MIKLLTNNPYRILGVFSNSPKKEVLSNLNKMKAFLKVGKSMSFPLDLPTFLPPIERTDVSVSTAQSAIELPVDQLKHTLFWFMKDTQFDEIAFNHLFSGNITQAKDVWSKKESVSSVLNLMACAMIEQDVVSLALNADKLFSNHATEFCQKVNETVKLTSDELTQLFVDSISEDSTFSISALANVSGTSSTWRNTLSKGLVSRIIDSISKSIQVAKQASGALANYNAGVKLMEETKQPLARLKGLLGPSDMQYQMIADKLANAILQCGINYYKASDEDDAAHKSLVLHKYALDIAAGQVAKERCQKNYDILKKKIANLPPKEVLAEAKAVLKELEKFRKLPDKIEHSLSLLQVTRPQLNAICSKLGRTNPFYLKLSTQVVDDALYKVIEEVNLAQKYDPAEERRRREEARRHPVRIGNIEVPAPLSLQETLEDYEFTHFGYGYMSQKDKDNLKRYNHVKDALERAWKVILLIDEFEMEKEFFISRYSPNRSTLKDLCIQCKIDTLSDKEREIIRKQKEEKANRDRHTRKQSNLYWIGTAIGILLLASIIAVAVGHEFWEGLLVVVWPFPPVFILSISLVNLIAEQIWKLTGNKEKFNSFMD